MYGANSFTVGELNLCQTKNIATGTSVISLHHQGG